MSYILDALRRADSERERGNVPSIHSPPVPPVVDDPKPSRGQPQVLVGVIVVLVLALAGLLAWHLMSGKDAAAPSNQPVAATAPVADEPRMPPPNAMPTEAAMPQQPPMPTRPGPPPNASTAMAPPPMTLPPTQQPARQAPPESRAPLGAAPPVVTVPARPTTTASPTTAPAMATAPATTQADNRVYAQHDLPANIQRDLPKLVVGGAMYSDTPANRMLIINSQVFYEGDKLTPDLLLQEIKLKSAVFQYKGYRYGVSY